MLFPILRLLLLILFIVALVGLLVLFFLKRAKDRALRTALNQNEALARRVEALAKYQSIIDADQQARSILSEAKRQVETAQTLARANCEKAITEANARAQVIFGEAQKRASDMQTQARTAVETATAEAENVRRRAAQEAADLQRKAKIVLEGTDAEATRIIEEAKRKAQEIAGEAYSVKENVEQLEQTARALKNAIEGYGDRYLVPTYSVLDELAEEMGFTEAGQRLKTERGRVKEMIKGGKAATCDYMEDSRRWTAIAFVLDAFNGKVDTILADVRHDNFGTLTQKIKDAFALVNQNGVAFRRARITESYLDARLEELRWAVAVHELKLRSREEQRKIKEHIREEERAQREFEKAMKDAAKEEDIIRTAVEKARTQFDRASDEQKVKYEEQLRQLNERLRLAEEKNKRAISMAQQTRSGYVYIISNVGSFGEEVHKIGLTRRLEPLDRIKELGDASVPFEFDVHALIYSEDAPTLEHELHKLFLVAQVNKVNARKEFFRVPTARIRQAAEQLGCKTIWTMEAQAREYRETLAIEQAMKNKTFQTDVWTRKQLEEHEVTLREGASLDSGE
jgi:hypothetical protein